jgi:uncharacterized protein (TIGR03000 family)
VDQPLTEAEQATWNAYLARLPGADRKTAEAAWAGATTPAAKRALIAKIPAPLPVDKDEAPLTKAEQKVWSDYLNDLDAKDRKQAEAEWAKAKTNRAKRALIKAIPKGDEETSAPATLVVLVAPNAPLTIQGAATVTTGARRVFVSPALKIGQSYLYNLEARILQDGVTQVVTRSVEVRAGQTSQVDLTTSATVASGR